MLITSNAITGLTINKDNDTTPTVLVSIDTAKSLSAFTIPRDQSSFVLDGINLQLSVLANCPL